MSDKTLVHRMKEVESLMGMDERMNKNSRMKKMRLGYKSKSTKNLYHVIGRKWIAQRLKNTRKRLINSILAREIQAS